MNTQVIGRVAAITAAALLSAGMNAAHAQAEFKAYPARTVHVLVGNAAGSGNDLIARLFCQRLSDSLGQPFVVENRPSSGSLIAGEYVAKAPADGYTLLFATAGLMVNAPVMYARLAFSTERDFTAISMASKYPVVLISNASLPITSVRELITYARANPHKANYGAAGAGLQLAGALFKARSETPIVHIPYKGGSQVVNAVAAGDVMMALVDAGSAAGPLKGGRIRALAVASPMRTPLLPEVPTLGEAGVRDAEVELWNGLFAPAGTPPAVIRKLQDEMIRIAKLPDTRERLIALAAEPVGGTAEELSRTVTTELAKWMAVARFANIKPE
jgi:tripartite-type tricarboxylate transporter receptor subunit TctC